MGQQSDKGIAILCDREGIVKSVIRDELGIALRVPPGSNVVQLADPANAEKARNFILSLQNLHAAFDWEITVPCQDGLAPLHFTGGIVNDGFLIVAARSLSGVARVNEALMGMSNEQINDLRSAAKGLAQGSVKAAGDDGRLYEELTRVNNDLSNLQRELFRKNTELARINDQKNQLLGMAAHDLRSPLGAILSYSEFLDEEVGPSLNEKQREFLTTIKDISQFMLSLVNDLLDVAQLESGSLNMDFRSVDLAELVRRNVALNRVLAERKHIRMKLDQGPPMPPFLLDRGKIEQVLNNLLSNAIKFSHEHTEITVELIRDVDHAVIAVTDQGQGIPAEDLAKLFKPFSRTRVKSTAGESSTGLGLSIVRRIVEGHDGTVAVESQVGRGTSFRVRLPYEVPALG